MIYRRIDDDFLDPEAFRPDSLLGVPGLMRAYRAGNVALANAVGTGVADDKAVYAYMPRIIGYYLDEEPILANVETHICREPDGLRYTLDHLAELVVKPVGESGGYGITVGPARQPGRARRPAASRLLADPANYISQPMVGLSVCPTLTRGRHRAAPRRSAAVRDHRRRHLGAAGRPDPGGAAQGLADRQLLAGRRLEGHLGPCVACSPASPRAASGWRATWSAPRTSPASSTSTRPSPQNSEGVKDWLPIVQLYADAERFFGTHDEATADAVLHFYVLDRDNPTSIVADGRAWRARTRARCAI